MTVRKDLLAAIGAEPDADEPRQVYADWLEEHDEPARADFIRIQLERARLAPWDSRQISLQTRESLLLRTHGSIWRRQMPRLADVQWGRFERGFVAHAMVRTFGRAVEVRDTLARTVGVTYLEVPWPVSAREARAFNPLPGLRGLTIKRAIRNPEEPGWLARSPVLGTLHHLTLSDAYSVTPGTERLLSSPHLGQLRSLHLERNETGREGVPAITRDGRFPHLTTLAISEVGDDELPWSDWEGGLLDEPVHQLAAWPGLAKINALDLMGNRLTRDSLGVLLASPFIDGVQRLNLAHTLAGRQGLIPWHQVQARLRLRALDLGGAYLTDNTDDWERSPCLSELQSLSLGHVDVEHLAFERLLESPFAPYLEALEIFSADFAGADGSFFETLRDHPLPALHTLSVGDIYGETEANLVGFIGSPFVETLRALRLTGPQLKSEGARALAKSPYFSRLQRLTLSDALPTSTRRIIGQSALGRRLSATGGLQFVGSPD